MSPLFRSTQVRQGFFPNSSGVYQPVTLGAGVPALFNLWPTQNGPELLDGNGHPTGIGLAYSSPEQKIREDFGTTRFDANLSANDLLFAVYTIDDSVADTPTQNPLARIDESLREQVLSAQEQHVFSARFVEYGAGRVLTRLILFPRHVHPTGRRDRCRKGWVKGKPVGAIVIAGSTASNGNSQITGAGLNVGSNNATTRNHVHL